MSESASLAWLIENGIVLSISYAKSLVDYKVVTHTGIPDLLRSILVSVSNLALIECILILQYVLIRTVYSGIEPHSKGASRPVHVASCTLTVHLPVNLISMTVATLIFGTDGMDTVSHPATEAFAWSSWEWAANYALYRMVYDVAFYALHFTMHRLPRVYAMVHSTHHIHRSTDLTTNFQFTAVDLFVEGMLTNFVAMMPILLVNDYVPYFPLVVFATYAEWYQIGSHAHQRIPAVTALPPIAPIYNSTLAKRFRPTCLRTHDAVRFHADHHKKVKGNYGITPWMDWLFGTMVIETGLKKAE